MKIAGTNTPFFFYSPLKGQHTDTVCAATHLGPHWRKCGVVLSQAQRIGSGRHWAESWGSRCGMFGAGIPGLHNNHLPWEKLAPPKGKSMALPCEMPLSSSSGNPLATTSINLFAFLNTSFFSPFISFLFFFLLCPGVLFFVPLPSFPSCILTLAKGTAT